MFKKIKAEQHREKEKGYILLYVVVAITIFAALAVSIVTSTVNQVELSVQELAAVKANAAADTAVECISYWASRPEKPFYTNTPSVPIRCIGATTINTVGGAGPACAYSTSTYQIGPLSNQSCATVIIETKPRTIRLTHPSVNSTYNTCAMRIRADGFDSCSTKTTSRTRWETFGGWKLSSSPQNVPTAPPDDPPYNGPDEWDPAMRITATVDSTTVLQAERSNISNSSSTSNTVTIKLVPQSGGFTNPFGETVGFELLNPDDGALPFGIDGIISEFTPRWVSVDAVVGASTTMIVSIPTNTPAGVYVLKVKAFSGPEFDTVVIPLDVVESDRGQL